MRKLTTSVADELSVFHIIIVIEIKYIPETQLSKTSKYHFEILDLESHKYEKVDYFSL